MNVTCSAVSCPVLLNSNCVFYEGADLIYTGINTNDTIQDALQKIDAKFADAGLGYAFNNGLVQATAGSPVQLGGSLIQNTNITGNYRLTFQGSLKSAAFVTTGGTNLDVVLGDGTLAPYGGGSSTTSGTSGSSGRTGTTGTSGSSATSGSSGSSGNTGTSGSGGTSGTNGTSGRDATSGTSGSSGSSGTSSTSGSSGTSASSGTTGTSGIDGGLAIWKYSTNTDTSSDPGTPYFRLDNATWGISTTSIAIDNVAFIPNTSFSSYLDLITPGTVIKLVKLGDPLTYKFLSIISFLPNELGYEGYSVNQVAAGGTDPELDDLFAFTFIGAAGTSGSSGSSGTASTAGTSGTSGSNGTSGTNGTTGTTGTSGTSGTTGTSGTNGTTGSSGTSGRDATSGSSGTSASSGTAGSAGTASTAGTTGTSGESTLFYGDSITTIVLPLDPINTTTTTTTAAVTTTTTTTAIVFKPFAYNGGQGDLETVCPLDTYGYNGFFTGPGTYPTTGDRLYITADINDTLIFNGWLKINNGHALEGNLSNLVINDSNCSEQTTTTTTTVAPTTTTTTTAGPSYTSFGVMSNQAGDAGTACDQTYTYGFTWYFIGSGSYPTIGDTVYTFNGSTYSPITTLDGAWVKIANNHAVKFNGAGAIVDDVDCSLVYTWYLKGSNTLSDPCSLTTSITPVYTSASALSNGVTIYDDAGFDNVYTGFAYINNSVTKWTMNSGVLTNGVSC